MTTNLEHPRTLEYPRVVSHAEWLAARKKFLTKGEGVHPPARSGERRAAPEACSHEIHVADLLGRTSVE
jgi:hypothetical protein